MSIRVITEPSIYFVGEQAVITDELDRFLCDHDASEWTSDAPSAGEELVETAGRLCYMSFRKPRPGGNAAYTKHILEVGHGSVLEHAVFNFILTGVSRSFTHELVRHRVGFSYSQVSQRYVDESNAVFVLPPIMDHCSIGAYVAWEKHCETALQLYRELVDHFMELIDDTDDKTVRRKQAREAARSVLPNCTETKIFVTANARALRHFIELRASEGADAEIRRVAVMLHAELAKRAPNLFGDYRPDGVALTTDHRKV